jgi:two-component system OmpR family sensor kinase
VTRHRDPGGRTVSFRFLLAVRVTLALSGAVTAVALLSYFALRQALDRELEASMMAVASIQAATVTADPSGEMRFHEWELTPEEASSVRDLIRYLQIWNTDGESLLRTSHISEDLPLDTVALAKAGQGELAWTNGTFEGMPIRALYYPLERMGELHIQHVLQVAAPLEARNRMLRRAALLIFSIVVTAAAAAFPGGWWLAGRAVEPVDTIVDQAEAITAGSPRRTIDAYADTWEYKRLVQVLNRMLARLQASVDAQRRFTADASHELRTPLTVLRGELEVALRRPRTPEEYARVLRISLEEAERLSRLAEDLMTLTRSEAGGQRLQLAEGDLAERARHAVSRLSGQAQGKEIEIVGPVSEMVRAEFDPDLMDRVLGNLLSNAIKFTPVGGRVEVRVQEEGDRVALQVTDTGPGIPPDQLDRVFDRFFRIDEARTSGGETSGTGLGLAIVKAIVDLHGGEVVASNDTGGGAVFRVTLPASQSGPAQHEEPFMRV